MNKQQQAKEINKRILPPEYYCDNWREILVGFHVLGIIMITCLMLRIDMLMMNLLLHVLTVCIKVNDLKNEMSKYGFSCC
jgi:hypothetical protein